MNESEPKNPYPDNTDSFHEHRLWQAGYDACQSYYSSLVGEKGREALVKEYCKHQHCYDGDCEWKGKERCPQAILTIDSFAPIIAALADKLAEERIKEILKHISVWQSPISKLIDGAKYAVVDYEWLQAKLKEWGVEPKEGKG